MNWLDNSLGQCCRRVVHNRDSIFEIFVIFIGEKRIRSGLTITPSVETSTQESTALDFASRWSEAAKVEALKNNAVDELEGPSILQANSSSISW